MKLYIIGNGFDLAHKLPTEYWNFRTYLESFYPDFLNSFEQHYNIYPGDPDEYKTDLLWNTFETNLANINENVIIENALALEMGLESGSVGIEDTLREHFKREYQYIDKLAIYLKQWVRTIKLRNTKPIVSSILNSTDDHFITFNYTSVLENIYKVKPERMMHIHGSLHDNDDDPILGHGNKNKIEDIKGRKNHAKISCNEAEVSICSVIHDYYNTTLKNVNNYMHKLSYLWKFDFNEIIVAGHSVAGIDLPYFRQIDDITKKKCQWKIYYYRETEKEGIYKSLIAQNFSPRRFELLDAKEFYDIKG